MLEFHFLSPTAPVSLGTITILGSFGEELFDHAISLSVPISPFACL